jgi:hypothetical protein
MAQTKIKLIADGVIDVNNLKAGHTITTDNIGEGTNLYYTDARVGSYLSANSYATEGYVTTAVSNLVDAAPSTLDTLNELAAALGDDPNFATTVTNSIATKLPLAGGTISGNLTVSGSLTGTLATAAQTNVTSVGTLTGLTVSGNLTVDTNTLFVDAANNRVGIGNASPVGILNILGNNAAHGNTNIPSVPTLQLDRSTDDSGNYAGLVIKTVASGSDFGLYSNQSGALFYHGGSERMRITSDGKVGIGTTSPARKLHLYDTSDTYLRVDRGAIQSLFGTDDVGTYVGQQGAYDLRLITNASEKIRIKSDGNVGIGTSSPTSNLEVNAGSAILSKDILTVKGGGSTGNYGFRVKANNDDNLFFVDTLTYNVGVGTTSINGKLHSSGGAFVVDNGLNDYQTAILTSGVNGTIGGELTITVPDPNNFVGYGSYSCEVFVSGYQSLYCHAWFSGYTNGGIYGTESTILRSGGSWSISQSSGGNQQIVFVINYPSIIHPTARIIFNKGGSTGLPGYDFKNATITWS